MFDWENRLSMDSCALLQQGRDNQSLLDYNTFNFYNSDPVCTEPPQSKQQELVAKYPNMRFRTGYGIADGCTIDQDSALRNDADAMTHGRERRQLQTRTFVAVPDTQRGIAAPTIEYVLQQGQDTSREKCTILVERDFDRFTPFIDCVGSFIGNELRVLPELNRLGDNSRDIMRKQCNQS